MSRQVNAALHNLAWRYPANDLRRWRKHPRHDPALLARVWAIEDLHPREWAARGGAWVRFQHQHPLVPVQASNVSSSLRRLVPLSAWRYRSRVGARYTLANLGPIIVPGAGPWLTGATWTATNAATSRPPTTNAARTPITE